ncbi:calcineurin-binding protein cabin-1-like [Girardinichthys multiradiatus]|uniref:calcineurin-binding protein cabin-1-like n=1 Tax=Girardinichthys multiradiatus TaxID=208333 RepID=UPI001FABF58F|nr:calcineurin-binding protein cabin-1-like [Girardinichthys multiradiatus]
MEALELHFRLSASILKLLQAAESNLDHDLLFNLLVEAATGPFAKGEEKSMPSLPRSNEKEKPPTMMEEEFNCSSVCIGNVLSSSPASAATPAVTSPPYVATPFDHDYAKRKTLRRQQWQQQRHEEQQADGTVPVLDTASGVGLFAIFAPGQKGPLGSAQIANHHAQWLHFQSLLSPCTG